LARLTKLEAELRRATRLPEDPEAIHDLRVAIRRFLQCLACFEQFFDAGVRKKAFRRLKKLLKRCGAVRDCDISIELLKEAAAGPHRAIARLEAMRLEAGRELVARLKRWPRGRAATWRRGFIASVQGEGPWDSKASAGRNAAAVLPGLAVDLLDAGCVAAAPGATYEEMHQFRLKAKRFRYTLEIFAPVYKGREAANLKQGLAMMRGLQDRLGAINDCVTAHGLLQGNEPAQAAVDRVMKAREQQFRDHWKRQFGQRTKAWWMAWLAAPGEAE
jgi:CHAD domain-containing protein